MRKTVGLALSPLFLLLACGGQVADWQNNRSTEQWQDDFKVRDSFDLSELAGDDTAVFTNSYTTQSNQLRQNRHHLDSVDDFYNTVHSTYLNSRQTTAVAARSGVWFRAEYSTSDNTARLYRSTSVNSSGTLVYTVGNHTIDALAIGDFDGSGLGLIVGMNHTGGGGALVWRFPFAPSGCNGTMYGPCDWYSGYMYGYNNYERITDFAVADFDFDGDDDLAWAFNGTINAHAQVFLTDYQWGNADLIINKTGYYEIQAITAGDYQGVYRNDLVVAFGYNYPSGQRYAKIERYYGASNSLNERILPWTSRTLISSMATGDLVAGTFGPGAQKELIVGMLSSRSGSEIYLSRDGIEFGFVRMTELLPETFQDGLLSWPNAKICLGAM